MGFLCVELVGCFLATLGNINHLSHAFVVIGDDAFNLDICHRDVDKGG